MRSALLALVLGATGCASTVYRLEGEPINPGGTAQNTCESEKWLVIAPTRADVAEEKTGKSHPENGLGLYRVGSNSPESIPSVEQLDDPIVARKRDELAPHRTKQYVAGGLGAVGVIGIAVGTGLFVSAFESHRVQTTDGTYKEESKVNGGRAGAGGIVVGLGFAFGIAGLLVNPDHSARTKASASQYVFLDPPDSPDRVNNLVERHNLRARETCGGASPVTE
jgi:hypothetical protein